MTRVIRYPSFGCAINASVQNMGYLPLIIQLNIHKKTAENAD